MPYGMPSRAGDAKVERCVGEVENVKDKVRRIKICKAAVLKKIRKRKGER